MTGLAARLPLPSFSQRVKDDLGHNAASAQSCRLVELAVALAFAQRQLPDEIVVTTANPSYAGMVARLVLERYHRDPDVVAGRETISVIVSPADFVDSIRTDLMDTLGVNLLGGPFRLDGTKALPCRQAILRAAFLAGGSIRDPSQAYHLEFVLRRPDVAAWLIELLASIDIHTGQILRHGHTVVYIKEGQQIADFLQHCGAHQSLLAFESLRVEKEMRNTVNRVVNCDNANSSRIANTSARQLELLHRLAEAGLFSSLPEDLVAAAQARLDHPDLSLKELGETLRPPLGKSGMNHRLKKLEQLAVESLGIERKPPHA
jgi:hypothetical protein